MIKIAIVFVALLFVHHVAAQCAPGVTPKICKYGDTPLTPFAGTPARATCTAINTNPFEVNSMFGNGDTADECATAVQEDGSECRKFYAELQCSGGCPKCNTQICPRFCQNFAATCPTATSIGCFSRIFCASNGEPCSDWDVSNSLPAISTTSTSTTRTTTTGTGTGTGTHTTTTETDDSAAGSFSVSVIASIAAVIFIFA